MPSAPASDTLPRQSERAQNPQVATSVKTLVGLFTLLLAFYGFWRIRASFLSFAGISDLLYLASLYRDLATHHYSLHGWALTPAPYFFPDMPVFFLSALLTPNFASAYCLYAGLMLAGTLGGIYLIAGFITRSRADRLLATGLLALLVFAVSRTSGSNYWFVMKWFLAPSGHGGGFVAGIFLIGLELRLLDRITPMRAVLFFLLTAAMVVSDRLVLTEIIGPVLLAATIAFLMRRGRTQAVALAIMAASVAIAHFATDWYIRWTTFNGPIRIPYVEPRTALHDELVLGWQCFTRDWRQISGWTSALFILAALGLVVTAIAFATRRRARAQRQNDSPRYYLILLITIASSACALSIALALMTSIWRNPDCFRYGLAVLVMPWLLLGTSGPMLLGKLRPWRGAGLGCVAAAIGIGAWIPAMSMPAVDNSKIFYTPTVQFIDSVVRKHNLHCGYGGYWVARPVSLFSRTGTVVNCLDDIVSGSLDSRIWVDNPNHWCQSPTGSPQQYPLYDFVVCPSVDEQEIRKRFGAPAAVEQEGGNRVLIYNRPEDILFRCIGRSNAVACADAKPARKIVKQRYLNRPKTPGWAWNGPRVRILAPGQELVVQIEPGLGGDVMEIAVNAPAEYRVEFRLGNTSVGSTIVGAQAKDGLQTQDVLLGPITGGKPFDTIVIRAPREPGMYSIASVQVFPDPMFHPQ